MAGLEDAQDAVEFAALKHAAQKRRYTGEPYVNHCIRVAEKLESLQPHFPVTADMLKAALLHDTVEDTECSLGDIRGKFGDTVARYVEALSLDPNAGSRRQRYAKYAAQLQAAPVEVQRIKICDMWDNIGDIKKHDPDFYPVYRRECLMVADHLDKLGPAQATLKLFLKGEREAPV